MLQKVILDSARVLAREHGFADATVDMRPNRAGNAVCGIVLPPGITLDDPVVAALLNDLRELATSKNYTEKDAPVRAKITNEGRVVCALCLPSLLYREEPIDREAKRKARQLR